MKVKIRLEKSTEITGIKLEQYKTYASKRVVMAHQPNHTMGW